MCVKSKSPTPMKTSENHKLGIPDILNQIRHEKISETVPVKLPYSLKKYLQETKPNVSAWVRHAILEELRREASLR